MDRVILHSDMNACYASIELLHHPELRGRAVAVGGDPETRHGIILAKSQKAKKAGVKTGMALWQARQVCRDLVIVPPHYDLYLRFSRMAHALYGEYTDLQEAFGIDECWLDVTRSCSLKGDGETIAREINRRVREELGITVSVGVSWNKIFAKLGSDYRKPDAVTIINRDNYRQIVYPLPAGDLLYVGRATKRRLYNLGILTIGDLAGADPLLLKSVLGKMGLILSAFARGEDRTPVSLEDTEPEIKSIGNSTTTPKDISNNTEAKIVLYLLAESVGARMREHHFLGRVVEIGVRNTDLYGFTRQRRTAMPTNITEEIARQAIQLFCEKYRWDKPLRSMSLRMSDLVAEDVPIQLDLFHSWEQREKLHQADQMADRIRDRFGYRALQRGLMYQDRVLSSLNAREDNVIHPHGYMERGNRTGAGDTLLEERQIEQTHDVLD